MKPISIGFEHQVAASIFSFSALAFFVFLLDDLLVVQRLRHPFPLDLVLLLHDVAEALVLLAVLICDRRLTRNLSGSGMLMELLWYLAL